MKNIKLKHYARLTDASDYELLENIKPKAAIKLSRSMFAYAGRTKSMNVNKMPYVNVKHCIRLLSNASNWNTVQALFEVCFDINEHEFWNLSVMNFFRAKNYIVSEFERVVKTEARVLASQSTEEHIWKMAGAERLQPYNDTLPLVQLGKLFGRYPFDVGRMPYSEVFSLLAQIKVQNEVESEYQKLITK